MRGLLCAIVLLAAGATAAAPADPAAVAATQDAQRAAVLAAEAARTAALVAADTAALAPLLADELSYGHSYGGVQDKAALLAALAEHRLVYRAITPSGLTARVYGTLAVVTGEAVLQVEAGGSTRSLQVHFLADYVWRDARWQLCAYQSVASPPPQSRP